jgi:hypothetical protein
MQRFDPIANPPRSARLPAPLLFALFSAAGLGLACTTGPDPNACDFEDVQLKVLHSPQLTFTWTPSRCGAFELLVTEGTPILWLTSTQGAVNTIHPPVVYGVQPPGASGPPGPALIPGIPYFAILHRADAARSTVLADTATFVYSPPD